MQQMMAKRNMGRAAWFGVLALVLAGCQMPAIGDWRSGAAMPPPDSAGEALPDAAEAEAACLAQGRAQGLEVRSVLGSRVQRDADERPVARDVMLRVARDGRIHDLRCNYHYASETARIMTL